MKKIDRVKRRFVEHGLEAAPRKRKADRIYPRKMDGTCEAHLVALICSQSPPGARPLAAGLVELHQVDAISHETVRRVLKKTR